MLSKIDILKVDIKSELAKIENNDDVMRVASHYLDAKIEVAKGLIYNM